MAYQEVGSSSMSNTLIFSPNSRDDSNPTTSIQRRPRGRPPGSKNKPKPPASIVTRTTPMKTVVLEISVGSDIIEAIINFARKSKCGVVVISASGWVSNVTIRYPMCPPPAATFGGPFNLVSLSGSFVDYAITPQIPTCFGITFAGNQGNVYGGIVAGKAMAASTVVVVVVTFSKPSIHRIAPKREKDDGNEEMADNSSIVDNGSSRNTNAQGNRSMSSYGGVGSSNAAMYNAQIYNFR